MPSTSGFIENETATLPVDDGGGVGVGVLEQENQRECPDAGTSQDFVSGITKIIPDVDVSSYFQAFIKLNDQSVLEAKNEGKETTSAQCILS